MPLLPSLLRSCTPPRATCGKPSPPRGPQKVAILDCGAQYGKVIDRRIRELAVECDLLPLSTPAGELREAYAAIVISGGPQSVYDADAPKYDPAIFELGMPVLGICYGMQLMACAAGGQVEPKAKREDGQFEVCIERGCALFAGVKGGSTEVLLTHGDSLSKLPKGFRIVGRSGEIVAAIECAERRLYGVQFHPEVDLSVDGTTMLRNFLFRICALRASYSMASREQAAIEYIRGVAGDKKVLVLVSGGVDSSVCAALLHKALGPERVVALHIDHGFMRHKESEKVVKALQALGLPLDCVDATAEFACSRTEINGVKSAPLCEVTSPEVKRKIIGDTFMRVTQQMVERKGLTADDVYLAQGTLRPDLIESASAMVSTNATVIKTHHNDTALVRQLRAEGKIIEPLADYHKDEVRELGVALGLPSELVWRQPFPGPGLAIRALCADEPYRTKSHADVSSTLRAACLAKAGELGVKALLLPVRTVGVQGDGRSYSYLAALSRDGGVDQPWEKMLQLAKEIPGAVHEVNRVVFLLGPKVESEPTTITPTRLVPEAVEQLRTADHIVTEILTKYTLLRSLAQVPVVLFPVGFGSPSKRSIGIRAFLTRDFMTGTPARPGRDIPLEALEELQKRILSEVPGIARIALDISPKPPATTEWE